MTLNDIFQMLVIFSVSAICLMVATAICSRAFFRWKKNKHKKQSDGGGGGGGTVVVGVFHPYCNAGGGGERVLWFAVQTLQEKILKKCNGNGRVVIYARKSAGEPDDIVKRAKDRFGVTGIEAGDIEFVFLETEKFLQAETFPRLTLLFQSLGSMLVGAEALYKLQPDIFFDTMGYAFTYPLAWCCGCTVATYTHYPTISTDMLQRVYERRPAYNNDELVSGSVGNSMVKYWYYRFFCVLYKVVGMFPKVVIVNSSWTRNHISSLWGGDPKVIFPPCDTTEFSNENVAEKSRVIVSLGQFRPEKDHRLQIQSVFELKKMYINSENGSLGCPMLHMYGSCRDEDDEKRIDELKQFAKKLGVEDLVDFKVNVPFLELKKVLGTSLLGIHTMWNEHFGIAPVEMMASGVILVAHNSGGPKLDIIKHGETGFLASSSLEYAECMKKVLDLYDDDDDDIVTVSHDGQDERNELQILRENAVNSVERFSQEKFCNELEKALIPIFC